jgi:hypothetical protein
MLVAPAESMLAGFKIIVAWPPTINAVAEVGVNATSVLPAAKVATPFDNSAPLPSLTVAVAVIGFPHDTVLSEKLNVIELWSVGVGVGVGVGTTAASDPPPVEHP